MSDRFPTMYEWKIVQWKQLCVCVFFRFFFFNLRRDSKKKWNNKFFRLSCVQYMCIFYFIIQPTRTTAHGYTIYSRFQTIQNSLGLCLLLAHKFFICRGVESESRVLFVRSVVTRFLSYYYKRKFFLNFYRVSKWV